VSFQELLELLEKFMRYLCMQINKITYANNVRNAEYHASYQGQF